MIYLKRNQNYIINIWKVFQECRNRNIKENFPQVPLSLYPFNNYVVNSYIKYLSFKFLVYSLPDPFLISPFPIPTLQGRPRRSLLVSLPRESQVSLLEPSL